MWELYWAKRGVAGGGGGGTEWVCDVGRVGTKFKGWCACTEQGIIRNPLISLIGRGTSSRNANSSADRAHSGMVRWNARAFQVQGKKRHKNNLVYLCISTYSLSMSKTLPCLVNDTVCESIIKIPCLCSYENQTSKWACKTYSRHISRSRAGIIPIQRYKLKHNSFAV